MQMRFAQEQRVGEVPGGAGGEGGTIVYDAILYIRASPHTALCEESIGLFRRSIAALGPTMYVYPLAAIGLSHSAMHIYAHTWDRTVVACRLEQSHYSYTMITHIHRICYL